MGPRAAAGSEPNSLAPGRRRGSSFKEALYYEKEGYANPSVAQLAADLTYIQKRYSHDRSYLTRAGKPVIMAYADKTDNCATATRWKRANAGRFYVVLKVFAGYRSCADQPDGWHQYGPSSAQDSQGGYSFSISPGFWRKGDPHPRLVRDLTRWAADIRNMVASRAPFQLVTTFNEWGEGTAVEASDRMADGSAGGWSSHSGYGAYLDLLHANIPGATTSPTSTAGRTPTTLRTAHPLTTPEPTATVSQTAVATTAAVTTHTSGASKGSKVLVIMEENHTLAQVKSANAVPGAACNRPTG